MYKINTLVGHNYHDQYEREIEDYKFNETQ